jgi:hypothetical protein
LKFAARERARSVTIETRSRPLLEPLGALQEWAIQHLGEVSTSPDTYDRV